MLFIQRKVIAKGYVNKALTLSNTKCHECEYLFRKKLKISLLYLSGISSEKPKRIYISKFIVFLNLKF